MGFGWTALAPAQPHRGVTQKQSSFAPQTLAGKGQRGQIATGSGTEGEGEGRWRRQRRGPALEPSDSMVGGIRSAARLKPSIHQ